MTHGFFKAFDQFVDAGFGSGRDIYRMIARKRQGPDNSLGNITGIDEIPRLIAVTIDGNPLIFR